MTKYCGHCGNKTALKRPKLSKTTSAFHAFRRTLISEKNDVDPQTYNELYSATKVFSEKLSDTLEKHHYPPELYNQLKSIRNR
jgi:hypothetical protein